MPQILTKLFSQYFLACSFSILAQNAFTQTFELGVTAGFANYIGDLAPTPVISETKPAGGFFSRINFSSSWAMNNSIMIAQVSGNDRNFDFNAARNLNFKSNIYEVASTIEFNYLKYGVGVLDNKFTSYLFAGMALFAFNPQGNYNGGWVDLRNLQTEGASNAYKPYSFAIPFGIGLKWRLNRSVNFECQLGFRKTYTDYLDDVSKEYPDMSVQIQKSSIAAIASDPSSLINENVVVNKSGYKRGNADFKDWYLIGGVSLSYRIYSKIKCGRFY